MAVQFLPQVQPEYPRNALLEVAGINQGIDSLGNAMRFREQQNYRAAQDAKENARADARLAADSEARRLALEERAQKAAAGVGQAILSLPPEMQGQAWAKTIQSHPNMSSTLTKYGIDINNPAAGAKFLVDMARGPTDPLEEELKRAQIAKMKQEAAGQGARSAEYGLQPQYAQDSQGNFVPWVPGKAGEPKVIELPNGLKALAPADTAYQRAMGREQGEAAGAAQADLRRVEDNAGLALATIDKIRAHPGKEYGLGWTAPMSIVPGSAAKGFANLVDQAAGQTFLEAFNSLKGGGQITEAEGRKASQALARLDRMQSPEDFEAALADLESVIRTGMERARYKARGGQPAPAMPQAPAMAAPVPAGEYVYNPQTGRVEPKR